MITRIVKMTFKEEETEEFIQIFNATAEFIGSFDGCYGVTLLEDSENDKVYFTLSKWQSQDHLNVYRSSDVFKKTWAKLKPLFSQRAEAWSLVEKIHI